MKKFCILGVGIFTYVAWKFFPTPTPTTLSLRIGQTFHEIANSSSFPVMTSSNIPQESTNGSGVIWITKPSVVIHFNDPEYEFTLSPTTFAVVTFTNYRATSISTSPMLEKLSFNRAFDIAKSLQQQFQKKGWHPENNTTWLALSDKKALHHQLRLNDPAYRNYVELVASKKYSMIFRFRCSENCDSRIGLDRYLIDVGVI